MRYKRASVTMLNFENEVEGRLQAILLSRTPDTWGGYVPVEGGKVKSTTYGAQYPLFNAMIDGSLGDQAIRVTVAVNWYAASGDYPYYAVWIEPTEPHAERMAVFEWRPGVEYLKGRAGIRLDPKEDDFALERDFGVLLDELVRFFEEHASETGA